MKIVLCIYSVRLSRHLVIFFRYFEMSSSFNICLSTTPKKLISVLWLVKQFHLWIWCFWKIRLAFYLLHTLFWFLLVSYYKRFQKFLGKKLLPFFVMIFSRPNFFSKLFFYMLAHDTAHVLECFCFVNFHSWLGWRACSFVSLQNFAPFSVIIWTCNVLDWLISWANVSEHSNKKN